MRVWGAALAVAMALAACSTSEQQIEAASAIKTGNNQFLPYRKYTTGFVRSLGPMFSTEGDNQQHLGVQVDKQTGSRIAYMQVTLAYRESYKRKYAEARDARAGKLKVERLVSESRNCSKKSADCLRFETLNVVLDEAALRSAGADGYPVKLFGITDQGIRIDIPQALIAALFAKVDAGEKQIAADATAR